jgi:hypothetical protein
MKASLFVGEIQCPKCGFIQWIDFSEKDRRFDGEKFRGEILKQLNG